MKSYPSTDLIAFGACPPIASRILGLPIGSLGRIRGEAKREADVSWLRLARLALAPPGFLNKNLSIFRWIKKNDYSNAS